MEPRTAVVIGVDGALLGLIILGFFYPVLSIPVLIAIVAWLLVLFFVRRPFGRNRAAPGFPRGPLSPTSTGLGSTPAPAGPTSPTDFCLFCGTTVPPGTTTCPTCRRPVPYL
jgi:hypothetical protein